MSDLLTEVDEMMRQERMQKFWDENGRYVIGFVVGTILLTAIMSGYKAWNSSVRQQQTAQLIALQDDGAYPQNILDAEKLDLRGGLRGTAYLTAASEFWGDGKRDEALALYNRVSADKGIPDGLRYLADLTVVRMSIDAEDADADAFLEVLKPIWRSKGEWAYHARLEAAVVEANLNEDYEAARAHLAVILEGQGLPQSLYAKAKSLNHVYSLRAEKETK